MKKIEEKLLFIFIVINPFFDLLSSVFNDSFLNSSPATFLRPIIPLMLLGIIFYNKKELRPRLTILMTIYTIYMILHLIIFKNYLTEFSYGTVLHEMQYLLNYTYTAFMLYIFIFLIKDVTRNTEKAIAYAYLFYITTIYISIITNTSFNSYFEGVGYKGWYGTSGAVSSFLLLSSFAIIPYLINIKKSLIEICIFMAPSIIFQIFFIGSRVGLYGTFILIIISCISYAFFKIKKLNIKKVAASGFIISILFVSVLIFGSNTFDRRKMIDDMQIDNLHIDKNLNIKRIELSYYRNENLIKEEQFKSLNELFYYANKEKIPNTDLRRQQLIYNGYLYLNQDDVSMKLFGNGYLINYPSLTLEMETISILFNFGIIGFILYMIPFLSIFFIGVLKGIKEYRQIDFEYVMYFSGIILSYAISTYAGHLYFNTSLTPVIIILHILFLKKSFSMGE